MSEREYLHADLTESIIACFFAVHRELGTGFSETIYRNAMTLELEAAGLSVASEVALDVAFRGHVIGRHRADLIVDELVVVELKTVAKLAQAHIRQVDNYLRINRFEVGLVLNFGSRPEIRRRIWTRDRKPPLVRRPLLVAEVRANTATKVTPTEEH